MAAKSTEFVNDSGAIMDRNWQTTALVLWGKCHQSTMNQCTWLLNEVDQIYAQ
jgi:hypothetical protein